MDYEDDDEIESSENRKTFNIYKYDAQLALAFQSDCEKLLRKFSDLKNYKFEAFAQVWKESCFVSIFESHENVLMLRTFVENCFFIAKKFLFFPDFYIKTGTLYLLYSLYYKQPIKEWVKIRLVESEYEKIQEILFFHLHHQAKSLEASFIYHKMQLSGAFEYCALPLTHGLTPKYTKRFDLASEEIFKEPQGGTPLDKFQHLVVADGCLKDLQETEDEYQKLIREYQQKQCPNLSVFPTKIVQEFEKAHNKIFNLEVEENAEESDAKKVKRKAVRRKKAPYRAEKATVTAVDLGKSRRKKTV